MKLQNLPLCFHWQVFLIDQMGLFMKTEDCFFLGSISKTTGLQGNLVCFIDADDPLEYSSLESVFVEKGGSLVPHMIEELNVKNHGNQFVIKFEKIDSRDEALQLVGSNLFLPLDLLPPLSGNSFYFHEVMGFEITDSRKGTIGRVINYLDYPQNPILEVENDAKKIILIPARDEIIKNVDRAQKFIVIEAPDGLIDLYLDD